MNKRSRLQIEKGLDSIWNRIYDASKKESGELKDKLLEILSFVESAQERYIDIAEGRIANLENFKMNREQLASELVTLAREITAGKLPSTTKRAINDVRNSLKDLEKAYADDASGDAKRTIAISMDSDMEKIRKDIGLGG